MPQVNAKKLVLAGAGAAVLGLGVALPAIAFAQDPTPSPGASASAAADREERQEQRRDRMAELLAEELGISKEEVAAALEAVETQLRDEVRDERQAALKERLDAAVAEGTLTQEQADAILAAAEAGVLGGGPGGPHGHGPGRPGR
jgi:hypothetical protein